MFTERVKNVYVAQLNGLQKTEPKASAIAKEIIDGEEINGWVNRETATTILHLSSDYDLYQETLTKIGGVGSGNRAATVIERWVKYHHMVLHHEPDSHTPRVWALLLFDVGSIWRVDWQAVTDYFTDE